jgi:hypothetical protein
VDLYGIEGIRCDGVCILSVFSEGFGIRGQRRNGAYSKIRVEKIGYGIGEMLHFRFGAHFL